MDNMIKVEKNLGLTAKEEHMMNYNDLLETAFSYLREDMQITEFGNNECTFCGNYTGYGNRYICPECWLAYEHIILNTLKEKTNNDVVKLEI